jgi:hypothetical protein
MANYRRTMDHEGCYAEAFFVEAGCCFRMFTSSNPREPGLADSSPEVCRVRGRFQDSTGNWYDMWSIIDHAGDLSEQKRVSASLTDILSAPSSPSRV